MRVLDIVGGYVKLVQVAVVVWICKLLTQRTQRIDLQLISLEVGLTLLTLLVSRKHFLDLWQLLLTCALSYALIPNNYGFLSGFYFFKIAFVYNLLGEAVEDIFPHATTLPARLLSIFLRIGRLTIVEYLFLGVAMLGYKIYTFGDKQGVIPEDYIILYKLIVTATTIGYGDVTPKTRFQIQYFTYAIPFICASFAIYVNALLPVLHELIDILTGHVAATQDAPPLPTGKAWSSAQQNAFKSFAEEVAIREAEESAARAKVGHNWIALAAANYEKQIPLLSALLQGDESKELKLRVCSKVRREYYPAGWSIIQAGEVSRDLMMVESGEVRAPGLQGRSFVFNREGFYSAIPARENIVTVGFVAVWAISPRDLQELAASHSRIQSLLSQP